MTGAITRQCRLICVALFVSVAFCAQTLRAQQLNSATADGTPPPLTNTSRSGWWMDYQGELRNARHNALATSFAGGMWHRFGAVRLSIGARGGKMPALTLPSTSLGVVIDSTYVVDTLDQVVIGRWERRREYSRHVRDTLPATTMVDLLELEGRATWMIGNVELSGALRARYPALAARPDIAADAAALFALTPGISVFARASTHPPRAWLNSSGAIHTSAGLQLNRFSIGSRRAARNTVAAAFGVSDIGGGRYLLRVNDRRARAIEVAGDFTQWQPQHMHATAPGCWEVEVRISPGLHRLAIRVDGGNWQPPPGVAAVPDDFSGMVGMIVVR